MTEEIASGLALCSNADCTVAETGICLEGHENYTTECPYYQAQARASRLGDVLKSADEAAIEAPTERERLFWPGAELGIEEAESIMRARYTHLIGIVGPTGVGKTCFINALYLKASSNDSPLRRYRFAGSRTLVGFEERARYARVWEKGLIPEKLSERTILRDSRQPGFLHLRLADIREPRVVHEVLLTDLPGEWFETMIDDASASARLMFLQRADGILLFVDTEKLMQTDTRHQEVYMARTLLGRLQEAVNVEPSTPITLVVSKTDVLKTEPSDPSPIPGVEQIRTGAQDRGFHPSVIHLASFSRYPELIPSGYGVEETLETILGVHEMSTTVCEKRQESAIHRRSFARFERSKTSRGF